MSEEKEAFDWFEADVKDAIGKQICEDDEIAKSFWSALANVDWAHPVDKLSVGYSFRTAGGLIAEIRGKGDYMDWYCCGPYSEVSDFIARSMKKKGWIADTMAAICDEPGCLNDAGCGTPGKDGYRWTCHLHRPKDWMIAQERVETPAKGDG